MKEEAARELLKKVKEDYQIIAKGFAASREQLWPELRHFLDFVNDGDRVLDAGCGNGRLMDLFAGRRIDYTGVDNTEAFIQIARERCRRQDFKCQIIFGDILNLPFEEEEFNAVACVAVLHHVPGEKLRQQALKEIQRVLKPGGILLLTAWNLWQPRYLSYVLKYNIKKMFGQSSYDLNDAFIPFHGEVKRYTHAFTLNKLQGLLKQAGFTIIESYYVKNGQKKHWWNGANLLIVAKAE
ncbi:MAG: methyltransferase domain-containing protein [bacterium]|nr:methyltransferase domain-containing protein [bacterium]